eukprot:1659499-Lingulodinium_polyedra.AAC.1
MGPTQLGNTPDGPTLLVTFTRQWAVAARDGPLQGYQQDEPTAFIKTDLQNAYGAAFRSVVLAD